MVARYPCYFNARSPDTVIVVENAMPSAVEWVMEEAEHRLQHYYNGVRSVSVDPPLGVRGWRGGEQGAGRADRLGATWRILVSEVRRALGCAPWVALRLSRALWARAGAVGGARSLRQCVHPLMPAEGRWLGCSCAAARRPCLPVLPAVFPFRIHFYACGSCASWCRVVLVP